MLQHVEGAYPHHRIGIGKSCSRYADVGGRDARRKLAERARARNGRCAPVASQNAKKRGGIGLIRTCGMESCTIGLKALSVGAEPFFNGGGRPLRRLVAMAIVACVRRAQLDRKIGPRDAEGMIVPLIDDHVGAGLHVARDACWRRIDADMVAMFRVSKFVRCMALQADTLARGSKLCTMRLVAIAAGDARGKHPALLEWRIVIGFLHIADLAVGMIGGAGERFDHMRLREPLTGQPFLVEAGAARVAQPAGLDLLAQRSRRGRASCRPALRIDRPGDVVTLVEANQQSLALILALAERPPALLIVRPGGVTGALSVTGLASHADFREGRRKAIRFGVVVLAQAGRVALRAHEIPVLV